MGATGCGGVPGRRGGSRAAQGRKARTQRTPPSRPHGRLQSKAGLGEAAPRGDGHTWGGKFRWAVGKGRGLAAGAGRGRGAGSALQTRGRRVPGEVVEGRGATTARPAPPPGLPPEAPPPSELNLSWVPAPGSPSGFRSPRSPSDKGFPAYLLMVS